MDTRISHFEIEDYALTKNCRVFTTVALHTNKNSQRHKRIQNCNPLMIDSHLGISKSYLVDENDVNSFSMLVTTALQHSALQPKKNEKLNLRSTVNSTRNVAFLRQLNDPLVALAKVNYKRSSRRLIFDYNAEQELHIVRQTETDVRSFWKIIKSKPLTPALTQSHYLTWKTNLD